MASLLTAQIKKFIQDQVFVNVATSSSDCRPNVAPKLLLKISNNHIFLADYVMGRTYRNLKENNTISLAMADLSTLTGYQLNGKACIIESGEDHRKLIEEFRRRQVDLCVTRIIEGIRKEKKHPTYETDIPERIAFFIVSIDEIVEIISTGELKRKAKDSV